MAVDLHYCVTGIIIWPRVPARSTSLYCPGLIAMSDGDELLMTGTNTHTNTHRKHGHRKGVEVLGSPASQPSQYFNLERQVEDESLFITDSTEEYVMTGDITGDID